MNTDDIIQSGFAMPLHSPAYHRGPYRFINREYLVITYRTDPEKLRALVPEPLQYRCENIRVHGAWSGPAALQLWSHALAPVADLPVLEVVSARHMLADLDLGAGQVVYDYLSRSPVTAGKEKRV